MSWARIVPVVALAWKAEAGAPAARVRLNAIAAQTSQAMAVCTRGRWTEIGQRDDPPPPGVALGDVVQERL